MPDQFRTIVELSSNYCRIRVGLASNWPIANSQQPITNGPQPIAKSQIGSMAKSLNKKDWAMMSKTNLFGVSGAGCRPSNDAAGLAGRS